jgi:hypothetical protein
LKLGLASVEKGNGKNGTSMFGLHQRIQHHRAKFTYNCPWPTKLDKNSLASSFISRILSAVSLLIGIKSIQEKAVHMLKMDRESFCSLQQEEHRIYQTNSFSSIS